MTAKAAPAWGLGAGTQVGPLEAADAPAVHRLILENRAHLDRWLRWSHAVQTRADVDRFIEEFRVRQAAGDGFHSGILTTFHANSDCRSCRRDAGSGPGRAG